jgi:hypothetical protein
MNWFYSKDGQQLGPVAFSEIQRLLTEGQITEESMVWQQGTPNWVKLSTVLAAPATPSAPALPIEPVIPAATVAGNAIPASAPVPVAGKTNGFAITSLVLSIIGLFCCSIAVFNIGGIVFGHLALGQIAKDSTQGGKGLATAGLIIGYIGLVLGIAALVYNLTVGWPQIQQAIEEAQRAQSGS